MAELVFFSGTMDCGKSTLALQTDHNHASRGRAGMVFTSHDRAGSETLSSRLGLKVPAVEVTPELDFWDHVVTALSHGGRVDYLICDEAQFYTPRQVESLARIVDDLGIDVFAFGITTDFRASLFPGSQRLIELADRVLVLQVTALCWCGARATHNARTVNGVMVVEGDQVVVGDTAGGDRPVGDTAGGDSSVGDTAGGDSSVGDTARGDTARNDTAAGDGAGGDGGDHAGDQGGAGDVVAYEVLCRRHHMKRVTAATANAEHMSPQPLPFEDGVG